MSTNARIHFLILSLCATSLLLTRAIAKDKDLSALKPKSSRATTLQGSSGALLNYERSPGSKSDSMPGLSEKAPDAKSHNPTMDGMKAYPIRINEKL